jgi:hypothetical protein
LPQFFQGFLLPPRCVKASAELEVGVSEGIVGKVALLMAARYSA